MSDASILNSKKTDPVPNGFMGLWQVSKSFGGAAPVLSGYTLELVPEGTTVLMGASGGGKTTILRMLLGLETPDRGTVAGIDGLRLAAVFQEDRLCENLSVMANVCLPHTRMRKAQQAELQSHAKELLTAVGLDGCATKTARDLSGGMKRRVALVRAALSDFNLIAFDEPLKGLDETTRHVTMTALLPYLVGKTVVWVTHDRDDLAFFNNPRVIELDRESTAA